MNTSPIRKAAKRAMRVILYALISVFVLAAAGIAYYTLTLFTPGPPQEGWLALTGAVVLVGEDLEPRSNTTVLIRDGIIIEIGEDHQEPDIPEGAEIVALSGYTLMPGLIDLHVHLASPDLKPGEQMGFLTMPGYIFDIIRYTPAKRRAFLNHGVTAVRSLGDDLGWIMEFRQMVRSGELESPRIFTAGPLFTTRGGHPIVTIGVDPESDAVRLPTTPEEARLAVREIAGTGNPVDLIKIVQERGREDFPMEPFTPEVLRAIVQEAHTFQLPVVAHWGTEDDLRELLDAGVDGLEHLESRGLPDGWPPDLLDTLVQRGLPLSPTLAVLEAATLRPENALPAHIMAEQLQYIAELYEAGGVITAGSDAGVPGVQAGPGIQRELELLVESGLPPHAALKAATVHAAVALRTGQTGMIEAGRSADLLVIDGDPLTNIRDLGNVMMVFRDGRLVVDHRSH